MPLQIANWERYQDVPIREFGLATLNLCRALRGVQGVRDCRYWITTASSIAIVTETEAPAWGPAQLFASEVTSKALAAMSGTARNTSNATWGDAAGGRDVIDRAGA